MLAQMARNNIDFRVEKNEAQKVRTIDSMKKIGKNLFGSGFIISDKTAAAKEAAAKEAAAKGYTFELSERERAIVEKLNGTDGRTIKGEITLF